MKITINILPEDQRRALRMRWRVWRFVRMIMPALAAPGIVIVFLVALSGALRWERMAMDRVAQQADALRAPSHVDAIRRANAQTAHLSTILAQQWSAAHMIATVAAAASSRVAVTDMILLPRRVVITGRAVTRDDVIALRDALRQASCVTAVTAPLSSLAQRANTPFVLTVTVKESCAL